MTNKQILILVAMLFFVLILFFISKPLNNVVVDVSITPSSSLPPQGYTESIDTFVYNFYIQKYPGKVPRISVGYNSSNIVIGYSNIDDKQYLWLVKYENNSWIFVQETEDYLDCSLIDKLTELPNVINKCRDKEGNLKDL